MRKVVIERAVLLRALFLSGALAGLAPAAWAQAAPPAPDPGPTADTAATGRPVDMGGIQDIVVTAQRRSENIQRSSLAIQAVAGDTLKNAGVSQAQDLSTVVPGLQIAQYGPIVQTFIRGVGDAGSNAVSVSPIAYNVDGVYVGRPESIGTNFYDLERVEVLKGPQGTLYGRNASGGAVNLITRRPKLGVIEGDGSVEIGNLNLRHVEAAANLPIGDTLAVRGAFNLVRRDGYLSDGTSDDQQTEGRLRVLWRPTDAITLLVNGDIAHVGGKGGGFTYLPMRPGAGDREGTNDLAAQGYLLSRLPILYPSVVPSQSGDFQNISAELSADLGFATLTVIPAYRHVKYSSLSDSGFIVGQGANNDQTSVEARLSQSNELIKWVAGLYYFNQNGTANARISASAFIQDITIDFRPSTKSYAAFGEATVTVTDGLRAIGGLRYTSDKQRLDGQTNDRIHDTVTPFSGNPTFNKVTWKAGAEYDVAPQNMVFVTASTGFKSGGVNQEIAPNIFKPEILTAYELGSRNRFLDNRLQVNLEIFYWKYKNKQESTVTFDNSFAANLIVLNSGQATAKGASVDLAFRLTSRDTFQLSTEYNDARYKSFVFPTVNSVFSTQIFDPASTGCAIGPVAPGPVGSTQRNIDCSGFRLPRAPEWTGSVGYNHVFDLANGANVTAAADMQYATSRYLSTAFTSATLAAGYVLVNTNLTYTSSNKYWSVTGFVRNVTNAAVYGGGFSNPFIANFVAGNINPPRTYGGRFSVNF